MPGAWPWRSWRCSMALFVYHSVWYPINLLAGSLYAPAAMPSTEALMHFNFGWFLFALAMHITMCLLVGLLYGAMLPMLPRSPDRAGRSHRAAAVDRPAVPHHRLRQSADWTRASTGGGLRFAGGVRHCRRALWSTSQNKVLTAGEHSACHARRHRSARPNGRARERGQEAMNTRARALLGRPCALLALAGMQPARESPHRRHRAPAQR